MKIPPQVIVGCGYLTDVIISPSDGVRSRSSRAKGNQVCSRTVHRERRLSRRYERSLWVNLKPCRKRDEADNIRKRTGIIGSNPIVAAVLLFIIRFSIAIRWKGMGHTGRKQNPH